MEKICPKAERLPERIAHKGQVFLLTILVRADDACFLVAKNQPIAASEARNIARSTKDRGMHLLSGVSLQ
jgi:hypothetical protein